MALVKCPTHSEEYDDSTGSCPLCQLRELDAGAKPRPPTVLTAGADPERDVAFRKQLAPTVAPGAEKETLPPAQPAATVAPQLPPRPLPTDRGSDEGPEIGDTPEYDRLMTDDDLTRIVRSNQSVVVLLGFASAGKSWFLNRLKHTLYHEKQFALECEPPFLPNGERLTRSNNISTHTFKPAAGEEGAHEDDLFHIIDMPGERFSGLANMKLDGRLEELTALKACRSLIIVLPADEVLLGERAERVVADCEAQWAAEPVPKRPTKAWKARQSMIDEVRRLARQNASLERFIVRMGGVRDLLALLEAGKQPEEIIAEARVRASFPASRRPSKPVFFAMAKADVIRGYIDEIVEGFEANNNAEPEQPVNAMHLLFKGREDALQALQDFDLDPVTTVRRFRPSLHQRLEGFRWAKLDFVTAFGDYSDAHRQITDPLKIDYSRSAWGVIQVIRWIQWAGRGDQLRSRMDWRYIAVARWLRRFRDEGRFSAVNRSTL